MTFIYLIVVLIINLSESSPQVIEGVNVILNGGLGGSDMFWLGLIIVFILDLILGNS